MDYKFNFVVDRIVQDKGYPALARHQAEPYTQDWREFGRHYPFTVPVNLHDHCSIHGFDYELFEVDQCFPKDSFYTIGISFFDFSIDYLDLLPPLVKQHLRAENLRLLFYYNEGDNPFVIKQHLDQLCVKHSFDVDCYRFVSGNTAADQIFNFAFFPDHELLFWHRNRKSPAVWQQDNARPYKFTILSRTHKWWRATAMTDLKLAGILDHSQYSYRVDVDCGDNFDDNPIEIDSLPGVRDSIDSFLSGAPYTCDTFDVEQQNNHHLTEYQHYTNSYCSIIVETHFDADGSGGAFLTEKTFKAIKNAHPFVIIGCKNSLKTLQKLGYKTFDNCINNSYDEISNNTERWIACKNSILELNNIDLQKWFESVRNDIEHNQRLFSASKVDRLNTLYQKLRTQQ